MYDPKFEKEIQRKMEELEFRPAESVWVNIEKAVVVKRRRRAGFIWRYLLPAAVFLVAAAGLYLHYDNVKTAGKIEAKNAGTIQPNGHVTTAAAASLPAPSVATRGTGSQQSTSGQTARGGNTTPSGQTARHNLAGGLIKHRLNSALANDPDNAGSYPNNAGSYPNNAGSPGRDGRNPKDAKMAPDRSGTREGTDEAATSDNAGFVAGQKGIPQWFYIPGLAGERLTPQVRGAALTTKKSNMVALAGLAHPQSRWEAGFVAGGGWSRLNRLNVDQAKAAMTSYATALYSNPGSSSTKQFISNTRPDASWDGGIYLQRALSNRLTFNTGMNLHYYSNRISVGQQVTTYVQASASYFIPTTSTRNASVYSAGDNRAFTNRYYFLELPVGLQWKVSKNHLLPVFLEGGISLNRLMGASALFYDAKTGLYSKDGDVVNKTQLNISSALLVGLPIHGIAIQLGPMVQYGLTPLVNTQGLGDQHFLYTGIRVVVIPGRK